MTVPFEADMTALPLALRYKLLTALVVPRPIALVPALVATASSTPRRSRSSMYSVRTRLSLFSAFRQDPTARQKTRSSTCAKPEHSSSTSSTKRSPTE